MRWPIRTESGSSIPRRLGDRRLVVEKIHLRRGARLEEIDHPLGLGAGNAAGPAEPAHSTRGGLATGRRITAEAGGAWPSRASSEPRAIAPRPTPELFKEDPAV